MPANTDIGSMENLNTSNVINKRICLLLLLLKRLNLNTSNVINKPPLHQRRFLSFFLI